MVKMITCITQPKKLYEIIDALTEAGIVGVTVTDVRGYGKQRGRVGHLRGAAYEVRLLPKVRLDIALPDEKAQTAVDVLLRTARSGEIGDGKVLLTTLEEAWRIRTGESGETAL